MKSGKTVLIVCLGFGGIAGGLVVAGWAGLIDLNLAGISPGQFDPSKPHPILAVDEIVHDFEVMAVNEKRGHQFILRNEGDATLYIGRIKIQCKCTKGIPAKTKLEPGEETTLDVDWKPTKPDENFQQNVTIVSNDPRKREYVLKIKGAIRPIVLMEPESEFNLGEISETEPTVVTGAIKTSVFDSFKILGIDCEAPFITTEWTPFTEQELKDEKVNCGYHISLTIPNDIPVGHFRELMTVRTDINGSMNLVWKVVGDRSGPFQYFPVLGADWHQDKMFLSLHDFEAAKGKKSTLMLFVTGLSEGEEFELLDVKTCVKQLEVKLEPDENFNKVEGRDKKKYLLSFEVPAGQTAVNRSRDNVCKVLMKTNHPRAEDVEYSVEFTSY